MAIKIGKDKSMDDGVWVDYDEDVKFKIRFLSPAVVRKIRSKHVRTKIKHGIPTDIVDDKKYNDSLVCHMIADWDGIQDIDGKKLECNNENIKLFIDQESDAPDFIIEFSKKANNYLKKKREKAEKN